MLHCFCLKLQWKTSERRSRAGIFIVNFVLSVMFDIFEHVLG